MLPTCGPDRGDSVSWSGLGSCQQVMIRLWISEEGGRWDLCSELHWFFSLPTVVTADRRETQRCVLPDNPYKPESSGDHPCSLSRRGGQSWCPHWALCPGDWGIWTLEVQPLHLGREVGPWCWRVEVFLCTCMCAMYMCVLISSMCSLFIPVLLCMSACWLEGKGMASDISEVLCLHGWLYLDVG